MRRARSTWYCSFQALFPGAGPETVSSRRMENSTPASWAIDHATGSVRGRGKECAEECAGGWDDGFIGGKFATCGAIWNPKIIITARKASWSSRNNTTSSEVTVVKAGANIAHSATIPALEKFENHDHFHEPR